MQFPFQRGEKIGGGATLAIRLNDVDEFVVFFFFFSY